MPSVVVKLYSVFFKLLLKHKLQNPAQPSSKDGYGAVSRPPNNGVPANAAFIDGVATKDLNIDTFTSLSLRIFLSQSALPEDLAAQVVASAVRADSDGIAHEQSGGSQRNRANPRTRRSSFGGDATQPIRELRRASYGGEQHHIESPGSSTDHQHFENEDPHRVQFIYNGLQDRDRGDRKPERGNYQGYVPAASAYAYKKLPVIVQFHGGGFVTGSKDSAANDIFCRRMTKLCHAIVIAVGYRLAPEHKYPAAFDDGFEALYWLAKQANLAECNKSLEHIPHGFSRNGSDIHRPDLHRELVDSFGGSVVEPWIAAHADLSRCVLLGVSSGGNIADHVTRRTILAGSLLEPVKIVAQVLMYPFFIGSIPTRSEIKLANSYFYDKATCILAWKLFLPDEEYDIDHPAANPLVIGKEPPLKEMPPTLIVVPELDWMKDRAIAYSEALRRANIDAPVLEYKDAVHEFATLEFLVNSRQAEACAEDMAIWIKKYISLKGYEFSY